MSDALATRRTPRHPDRRARATTAGSSLAPALDAAIAFVNDYAPRAPVGRRRAARADGRSAAQRRARSSSGRGRPNRPATTRRAPTTSCRPADSLGRRARLAVEAYGKYTQVQRLDPRGARRRSARRSGRWPKPRGSSPTAMPSRSASMHRGRRDEPHACHVQLADRARRPTAGRPPTTRSRARYGVDPTSIVRFDLNTSPAPPALVAQLLAAGDFDPPLSEYPPSDYRRLVAAAAARYGVRPEELIVGAGADEILDLVAKAFLPPDGRAVVPIPTYAMYRVCTEQRGATRRRRSAARRSRQAGPSTLAPSARRAARARRSSGSAARTTRPPSPSPTARSRTCSPGSPPTPTRPVARPRSSSSTRPMPSSSADLAGRPARRVSEPDRRADGQQGLRTGRPAGRVRRRPAGDHRAAQPVPAAGLGVDRVRHASQPRPSSTTRSCVDNLERVVRERGRLTDGLRAAGWSVGPVGRELRPGRTSGRRIVPPRSPKGCCARASSREPSGPATRWRDASATDRARPRRERPAHRSRHRRSPRRPTA